MPDIIQNSKAEFLRSLRMAGLVFAIEDASEVHPALAARNNPGGGQ